MNSSFDIGMKIRVEDTRCTSQEFSWIWFFILFVIAGIGRFRN